MFAPGRHLFAHLAGQAKCLSTRHTVYSCAPADTSPVRPPGSRWTSCSSRSIRSRRVFRARRGSGHRAASAACTAVSGVWGWGVRREVSRARGVRGGNELEAQLGCVVVLGCTEQDGTATSACQLLRAVPHPAAPPPSVAHCARNLEFLPPCNLVEALSLAAS